MNIDKILKDLNQLNAQKDECKKECSESIRSQGKGLNATIKNFLQDKSRKEYSEYFSQIFNMWITLEEEYSEINITPFNEESLDERYKEYTTPVYTQVERKSIEPIKLTKVKKKQDKIVLEYILQLMWPRIFKESFKILNSKINISHIKSISNNWLLYELINQISKAMHEIQEASKVDVKLSSLSETEMTDLIIDTDEICTYILDACMMSSQKNQSNKLVYFPELNIDKKLQVSNILAESIFVSYIFKCKQMGTKNRNIYKKNVNKAVIDIYTKLTKNNFLYNAIEAYIKDDNPNETIIKYENHLISPRIIFIFVISIIQEVIKKSLTQSRHNIFYTIKNRDGKMPTKRDTGLSEKDIMSIIKNDVKGYESIYLYFDNPTSETLKKKKEKLNAWIMNLNKLRYGVIDDYLFELYIASEISFKEEISTNITLSKKKII